MKRQQGKQSVGMIAIIVFAVIAVTGWYFYYNQQQLNKTISNNLSSENDALGAEIQDLQQALSDSLARNQKLSDQNNALKIDLSSSHEERSELQKNMQQELERITTANAEVKQELEHTTTANSELKQELKRMTVTSTELQQELQQKITEQESLNQQIAAATGTSDQLETKLEQEQERRRQLRQQIDEVSNDIGLKEIALSDAKEKLAESNRQLKQTQQEQGKLKATVEKLNRQRVDDAEHFANLKDRLEKDLSESRVVISQLKNRMTVIKLTSEVLFNSGSAEIKPAGKKVLSLIAESLNAYPERAISIEGHTDNVPIGKNSFYQSNWDLSTARALAALNFFQQKNQVNPNRLQLVGYGEHHPVSSNETVEGRELNRRIEIKMLPQK